MPPVENDTRERDAVADAIALAKFKSARLKLIRARHEHYLAEQRADLDMDAGSAYHEDETTQEL